MHHETSYVQMANRVGLFLVAAFVFCFIWYFVNPVEQELHMAMFKMSYFGFSAMDAAGFVSGLVQTYVWGYIFVGLWTLVRKVA